jgi:phosphate transport system permease protein
MAYTDLFIIIFLAALGVFWLGKKRSVKSSLAIGGTKVLHSLPSYHGTFAAVVCTLPALAFVGLWLIFDNSIIDKLVWASLPDQFHVLGAYDRSLVFNQITSCAEDFKFGNDDSSFGPAIQSAAAYLIDLEMMSRNLLMAASVIIMLLGAGMGLYLIQPKFRARNHVETFAMIFLMLSSLVAILTTLGIVLSVLFEALRFFQSVSPLEFLFGTHWSPQIAIRADQVGSSGGFGAVPLFVGTILISFVAMLVAAPVGLMSAIYLSEYAAPSVRSILKPVLEILAGIPTVVYGFFAALTVAPAFRDWGESIGLSVSSESALATGLVMGIMIIPFISSISDDVIHAVPQAMRDGSYGLGATNYETVRRVIIPAALPGIVGGFMLAISRAIGETMIVVMAAGLAANLTANPLESVTTVTVQIVTLLTGDQEFDSPKTLAAFALGLVLFCVTLVLNVIALHIVNKYREQYD